MEAENAGIMAQKSKIQITRCIIANVPAAIMHIVKYKCPCGLSPNFKVAIYYLKSKNDLD